jgi:hypothetical protein
MQEESPAVLNLRSCEEKTGIARMAYWFTFPKSRRAQSRLPAQELVVRGASVVAAAILVHQCSCPHFLLLSCDKLYQAINMRVEGNVGTSIDTIDYVHVVYSIYGTSIDEPA